jgi:hypothetical protein
MLPSPKPTFCTLENDLPRIPSKTLNLVAYLYHSVEDAETGTDFGGTAFFVSVPSDVPNRSFVYAVTNWHVAVRDGASILRVNRKDGGTDSFAYGPEQWAFTPKYDIAAVHVPLDTKIYAASLCDAPHGLVTREDVERVKLGPGEDVFMVGRFIDHDGGTINRPAVRFGHISVMPSPIEQPNGIAADAYCIDLHSRSGYSGSPVFVYRTPGYDLEQFPKEFGPDTVVLTEGTKYLALLGIHFAQFPEQWEIAKGLGKKKNEESKGAVPIIQDGHYIKGLSGMTCILPAWAIWEVLNLPELKGPRDEANARLVSQLASEGKMPPVAESAPRANDANPNHRGDFMRLVDVAGRKPEPKG